MAVRVGINGFGRIGRLVVRAGLKELEEKYLKRDYLRPEPLSDTVLERVYRRRRREEDQAEPHAARASRRRQPQFDE